MSNKPNKGFLKEISKNPKVDNKKSGFEWKKPIVKPSADPQAIPYRIREFKSVPASKTNLVKETKK